MSAMGVGVKPEASKTGAGFVTFNATAGGDAKDGDKAKDDKEKKEKKFGF